MVVLMLPSPSSSYHRATIDYTLREVFELRKYCLVILASEMQLFQVNDDYVFQLYRIRALKKKKLL